MKKTVWFLIQDRNLTMYNGERTTRRVGGYTPPILEAFALAKDYEDQGYKQTYYDFVRNGEILLIFQKECPVEQTKQVLGHKASARIPFYKRVLNFLKGE